MIDEVTKAAGSCGIFADMKKLALLLSCGLAACSPDTPPDPTWRTKPDRIISESRMDTTWREAFIVDLSYDGNGRLDSAFSQYPNTFVLFADFVRTEEQLGTFEMPWDHLVRAASAAQGQLDGPIFVPQEIVRHYFLNGRLDSVHALDGSGAVSQVVKREYDASGVRMLKNYSGSYQNGAFTHNVTNSFEYLADNNGRITHARMIAVAMGDTTEVVEQRYTYDGDDVTEMEQARQSNRNGEVVTTRARVRDIVWADSISPYSVAKGVPGLMFLANPKRQYKSMVLEEADAGSTRWRNTREYSVSLDDQNRVTRLLFDTTDLRASYFDDNSVRRAEYWTRRSGESKLFMSVLRKRLFDEKGRLVTQETYARVPTDTTNLLSLRSRDRYEYSDTP